jgi:proteasome lid subunit RPN8/RPN11
MDGPPECVRLERRHWLEMQEHVASRAPLEACGLMGGEGGVCRLVIPVSNIAGSPVRFRMDPEEQIQAMLRIEHMELDLLGIYHSHPSGPPGPSPTDYADAAYPEAAYLIWFPEQGSWKCRAFDLLGEPGAAIPIHILDNERQHPER